MEVQKGTEMKFPSYPSAEERRNVEICRLTLHIKLELNFEEI